MSNNITIYNDYTFMDDDSYKWTLTVEDDFTYIGYHDYENGRWEQKDELMLPTSFAYEIAKKIIQECEKNKFIMGDCSNAFFDEYDGSNDMINAYEENKDEATTLIWHDYKTDPPKQSGEYFLWFLHPDGDNWNKAYYNAVNFEWTDPRECVPYGNPAWGWSDSIPYKWAEIDLLEVE